MANAAVVAARRDQVSDLWLQGRSAASIAHELGVPLGTVKHDLTRIRAQLLADHARDLSLLQARSIASVRSVLAEAWRCYAALQESPPEDNAEHLALEYIDRFLRAHQLLARLGGVLSPNFLVHQQTTINLVQAPEWVATRSALLSALEPYPDARYAVVEALRAARAVPLALEAGGTDGRAVG